MKKKSVRKKRTGAKWLYLLAFAAAVAVFVLFILLGLRLGELAQSQPPENSSASERISVTQ